MKRHSEAVVYLSHNAVATCAHERMVCYLLRTGMRWRLSDLIMRVAHELYCEEVQRGTGWIGIGLFGPTIFESDARELLESIQCRHLVHIEHGTPE